MVLFSVIASFAAAMEPGEIGVVKTVVGGVSVKVGSAERALSVGDPLRAGDQIVTAAASAVGFSLNDGSRFSIGPNSAIVISKFQFMPERGLLALIARLLRGTLAHSSGDIGRLRPEAVVIDTPLGVVGVRGTRFAIRQPAAAGSQ